MIVLFPGPIIMKNLYRLSYMNPKTFFEMCIDALDSISRFSVMVGHFPFSWVEPVLRRGKSDLLNDTTHCIWCI